MRVVNIRVVYVLYSTVQYSTLSVYHVSLFCVQHGMNKTTFVALTSFPSQGERTSRQTPESQSPIGH